MNKSMIRYLLAKLLLIEAMLLCVPIVVALLNLKNDFVVKDSPTVFISLFATIAILLVLGGIGSFFKPKDFHIYAMDGVLMVALCWILWSFFGALPLSFQDKFQTSLMHFSKLALVLRLQGQLF